jgi:serine/threonine protein kinase
METIFFNKTEKLTGQQQQQKPGPSEMVTFRPTTAPKKALPEHHKLCVDPVVYQKAARYAVRVYDEMSRRSTILKEEQRVAASSIIAQFDSAEVFPYLGELLGKGGFNSVYELDRIQLTKECTKTQKQRNRVVANQQKLAVKFLSDGAYESPEDVCNGSADLYMEAKYLAALTTIHPHPALIQIHGISSAGPSGFGLPQRGGFFIIIDRLSDTLDRRIDVWKELRRRKVAIFTQSTTKLSMTNEDHPNDIASAKKYLKVLFLQRLMVSLDIASAIRHLHKLNIVFRDLKPDNVGFDFDGQVKIFDFGLAKELDPKQHTGNGLYTMSGGTGSRRYMAPEVSQSQPYGLSADLYSYGILVWEMLALEKAFGRMTVEEHRERVVLGTERPTVHSEWSVGLQDILQGCWARDPYIRPLAGTLHQQLQKEIKEMISQEFPVQALANEQNCDSSR